MHEHLQILISEKRHPCRSCAEVGLDEDDTLPWQISITVPVKNFGCHLVLDQHSLLAQKYTNFFSLGTTILSKAICMNWLLKS